MSVKNAMPVGHQEESTGHQNGFGHDHESNGFANGEGHQKFHSDDYGDEPLSPSVPDNGATFETVIPRGHDQEHISHVNGYGHDHESTGFQNGVGHEKFHYDTPQSEPNIEDLFIEVEYDDEIYVDDENDESNEIGLDFL